MDDFLDILTQIRVERGLCPPGAKGPREATYSPLLAAIGERRSEFRSDLSSAEVREWLQYEPETGVFTWLKGRRAGLVAGGTGTGGYTLIRINGVAYKAHRLAFVWMTGRWPTDRVDHVNGVTSDNRWANLREATHGQNMVNRSYPRRQRPDLPRGVYQDRSGRFQARVNRNGKQVYLGMFDSVDEAHAAYLRAAEQSHGSFLPSDICSSLGFRGEEHDGADAEGLSGRRAGIAVGRHPVDEAVQLVGEAYQPLVSALSAVRRDLGEGEGRERGAEDWLSLRTGMSADALADLLRSDAGLEVLDALMDGSGASWWPGVRRDLKAAQIGRRIEALRDELNELV